MYVLYKSMYVRFSFSYGLAHIVKISKKGGGCSRMQISLLMSQCMRFSTMWYVRPAKPPISLRICAVWSEPLLVAWVFYDCWATDWTPFGVSKLKRRLHRLVRVYTCQNATLLEITCQGSFWRFWKVSITAHERLISYKKAKGAVFHVQFVAVVTCQAKFKRHNMRICNKIYLFPVTCTCATRDLLKTDQIPQKDTFLNV